MKDSSGTAAAAEAAVFPHGGKLARIGWGIECAIKWLTEIPAALLVGVETLLLLANVFYRYVLHDPLTWGDELASILFMWLAMLGAVIALRRGEHMRLSSFVNKMAPGRRAFMGTLSGVVVIAFMLALMPWAYEYAIEEWHIVTPALEIRNTYRVLLTRARYETVIWVPPGCARTDEWHDPTRPAAEMDAIAAFLLRCGARPLAEAPAPTAQPALLP